MGSAWFGIRPLNPQQDRDIHFSHSFSCLLLIFIFLSLFFNPLFISQVFLAVLFLLLVKNSVFSLFFFCFYFIHIHMHFFILLLCKSFTRVSFLFFSFFYSLFLLFLLFLNFTPSFFFSFINLPSTTELYLNKDRNIFAG